VNRALLSVGEGNGAQQALAVAGRLDRAGDDVDADGGRVLGAPGLRGTIQR
jgi:hypothetical protein